MPAFHRLYRFFTVNLFLTLALVLGGCAGGGGTASPWGWPSASERQAQSAPDSALPQPQAVPAQPGVPTQQPVDYAALPPVRVAILLPLSGQHAALGQSMLQAAQLALFDIGYENFELTPRDTQGTAQGALQAASAAMAEGAQLILGPVFSDEVKAVKDITARRGVNMVAFSTDWTLAGGNTFVMGFLPFTQVQRVTSFAAANGIKSAGVIAAADKYGDTVSQAFRQSAFQNGITIARTQRLNPSEKNLDPLLSAFVGSKTPLSPQTPAPFHAAFLPLGGAQAKAVAGGLSYYGLPPAKLRRIGTGLLDNPDMAGDPNLQGAWFAAPSPAQFTKFERKYTESFGQKPLRLASLAYDATALAAVLAATGYTHSGKPAFDKAALTSPNGFAGTDGIFRFQPSGMIERSLAVIEIRGGQFVEIAPPANSFQSTVAGYR